MSFLGSTKVVLLGGVVLALLAWRKCHMVALLVVAATLSRPLVEHTLKISVQRGRPSIDRMVNGVGYSFPSGHVMAAATLWLMVPLVVSLYTKSRRVWMAATIASVTLVVLIAASRVYLGVHWPIDVMAGGLAAAMLLAGLDVAFRRLHNPRPCGNAAAPSRTTTGARRGRHRDEPRARARRLRLLPLRTRPKRRGGPTARPLR